MKRSASPLMGTSTILMPAMLGGRATSNQLSSSSFTCPSANWLTPSTFASARTATAALSHEALRGPTSHSSQRMSG